MSFAHFFPLVGCLSIFIHGGSLCIKDANYIGDLMLCNIAGNSGSEFLRMSWSSQDFGAPESTSEIIHMTVGRPPFLAM